jgi:hypothetical protein
MSGTIAFSDGSVKKPPVTVGMITSDVVKYYSKIPPDLVEDYKSPTVSEIVSSSLMRYIHIASNKGIIFTLAVDVNNSINWISTHDKSFKLSNGIGIGSTFSDIKKTYQKYEVVTGDRYIQVDGNIRFGFLWSPELYKPKIKDDEKVIWIELDKIEEDM